VAGDDWVVFGFFFFPGNLGARLITFLAGFATFAAGSVTSAARCPNRND
jgi:hypothetical protein